MSRTTTVGLIGLAGMMATAFASPEEERTERTTWVGLVTLAAMIGTRGAEEV